ncbi:MAG: substrate-binding domain-containing protein [Gammaproteobacteria bacterium]|nr:substrate-binding domain-containing protein [Gammaproteobacteria bacterium]MBT3722052.1 substrate-binding domain-containing protein [Gammaproteobacteria bacterium]MBT4078810.1 substrate-binding domain-containing protein [Gammaproteobacteria bacterium]MBT4195945.1 substrate-binding domain-containing protein [Gammaproteobacteria bacterium]MBT4451583.1 substrate-binding domain-containing protein [Gammaproteobacteria bacterium]
MCILSAVFSFSTPLIAAETDALKESKVQINKNLAYLVSDRRIPFWDIMSRGIENAARELGYEVRVYSAENNAKNELKATITAIKSKVSGLIISPTNSSASVTILKLAKKAGIPVVISDIGTDQGDYVSFISSNNKDGAYQIGKVLTEKMISVGWQSGSVGIIGIPQNRLNGQMRTAGFVQALDEAGIKSASLKQQSTFSYQETYEYSKTLINNHANLRAIWLQGSDRYQAALDAIADANKTGEILLLCFDAEPVFLELIPQGILVGAAMQQPYLMGEKAVYSMDRHLRGKAVEKNQQLNVLAISTKNINDKLPIIHRNVLGIEEK